MPTSVPQNKCLAVKRLRSEPVHPDEPHHPKKADRPAKNAHRGVTLG